MSSAERTPPRLEFADGDIKACGLVAYVLENGHLQLEFPTDELLYFCTVETSPTYRIIDGNMPIGVLVCLLRDMRQISTEDAILKLPKRLRAYLLRREQINLCIENHGDYLVGNKIETTGACTFAQVRLRVQIGDELGVIQMNLSYGEYSMHPISYSISTSGSDDYRTSVEEKADAIGEMLENMPLPDVCAELLS